jgi:Uma2 family endonuclease
MKKDIYAQAGITEYWLNLPDSALTVFCDLSNAGYRSTTTFTSGSLNLF